MPQNDQELLRRLQQNSVDFVVIGGVCCIFHGVPIATFDLDICCPFDERTLYGIEAAVRDLHPRHRLAANKLPLEITPELASRLKNLYLQTDLGILDCLGQVSGIGDYQQAVSRSVEGQLPYGRFKFLNLDAIIAAKQSAGREQDMAALRFLRPIRERLKKDPQQKPPQ